MRGHDIIRCSLLVKSTERVIALLVASTLFYFTNSLLCDRQGAVKPAIQSVDRSCFIKRKKKKYRIIF